MTLKEELLEKKEALAALKERIEADDAEAIAEGEALQAEIEEKSKEVELAEKKAALLNEIGTNEEETPMEGIKSMNLEALKGNRGTVSTAIKAYNDNEAMGVNQIIDYSKTVLPNPTQLGVRNLFSSESISGNALTYYVHGDLEGSFAATNEGAEKPQVHVPYTQKTVALAKIAGYLKETDELLSDAAFLESAIRGRGIFEFNKAVEAYLVGALAATSGIQSGAASISFDNILAAKADILADTGYAPDALIINPADWATLLQSKDSNLQYLLGGPMYGPYGNGSYNGNPRVWGLEVVESAAVPAGVCIVGAYKACASVVNKANAGLRVEVSNSNEDDFIKNIVTVRIEERIALAVRVPAAFEIVGTEASS